MSFLGVAAGRRWWGRGARAIRESPLRGRRGRVAYIRTGRWLPPGYGPPGRRPLRWIAMLFTVYLAWVMGGGGVGRSRAPPLRMVAVTVCHSSGVGGCRYRVRAAGSSAPTNCCRYRLPFIRPRRWALPGLAGHIGPALRGVDTVYPGWAVAIFSAAGWLFQADYGTMTTQFHPHTFPQKERGV